MKLKLKLPFMVLLLLVVSSVIKAQQATVNVQPQGWEYKFEGYQTFIEPSLERTERHGFFPWTIAEKISFANQVLSLDGAWPNLMPSPDGSTEIQLEAAGLANPTYWFSDDKKIPLIYLYGVCEGQRVLIRLEVVSRKNNEVEALLYIAADQKPLYFQGVTRLVYPDLPTLGITGKSIAQTGAITEFSVEVTPPRKK